VLPSQFVSVEFGIEIILNYYTCHSIWKSNLPRDQQAVAGKFWTPKSKCGYSVGFVFTKQDNEWLNGFNKWFSLMLRSNHDCQYLFTKNQTIAVIYYIMKYISKQESSLHSKLTIAAAVRKAMDPSSTTSDAAKPLLIKTYNKISSHGEVSIPELIAHLLGYPE
jgi:hypothetical protein